MARQRSIAIFIAIVRFLRLFCTQEEVSAIERYFHGDRSLPQNVQHNLRGIDDRTQFALRSIACTEGLELSGVFQRTFAICTAIDRFHRMPFPYKKKDNNNKKEKN
jgi:hypothetical protein